MMSVKRIDGSGKLNWPLYVPSRERDLLEPSVGVSLAGVAVPCRLDVVPGPRLLELCALAQAQVPRPATSRSRAQRAATAGSSAGRRLPLFTGLALDALPTSVGNSASAGLAAAAIGVLCLLATGVAS